jgi:hypothetical protein
MGYGYTLEKYKGHGSRHACPKCGRKEFVRYIDKKTGEYLADDVGRCNREVKCGYHYTPRQHFADNPFYGVRRDITTTRRRETYIVNERKPTRLDFISGDYLRRTLVAWERNNFIKFLLSRFSLEEVNSVMRRYLIGTWPDGRTVFWQVDAGGRVRTGKLIAYDAATGKRIKSRKISWVHAELKRAGDLPETFALGQCLFGEHLLTRANSGTAGVLVESEKTAVVASIFMPHYLWLATGGSGNLNISHLRRVATGRRFVLFPDSSKYDKWAVTAEEARRMYGLDVRVSDLLEHRLTDEQKREDYDIADFLLAGKAGT